jgi:hypothetical protein
MPDRSALTAPATAPAYVKCREDDWPLCPGCGADELWSNATPATIETIVNCLACDWRPGYEAPA